jgi:hypothetical protein
MKGITASSDLKGRSIEHPYFNLRHSASICLEVRSNFTKNRSSERVENITAELLTSEVFLEVTPCPLVNSCRGLGGAYYLLIHRQAVQEQGLFSYCLNLRRYKSSERVQLFTRRHGVIFQTTFNLSYASRFYDIPKHVGKICTQGHLRRLLVNIEI